MGLIRVNARNDEPVLHGSPAHLKEALDRALSASTVSESAVSEPAVSDTAISDTSVIADQSPIVIMIHGYKYQPGHPYHCPHRHILSLDPDHLPWRAPSWPRQLGFGLGHADEGLAIAFGWEARGAFANVLTRVPEAGKALNQLIAGLRARAPHRPLHVLGHSLGTAVALRALEGLPAYSVQRIISLSGAAYRSEAQEALCTEAGRTAEFFNMTSRENDAFDFLFERLSRRRNRGDLAIGQGLEAANAVTLQLDHDATLEALAAQGHNIGKPEHRICHWSSYMRPGALRFYKRLLRKPEQTPLARLQPIGRAQASPRWSRLLSPYPLPAPMPIWHRI